MLRTRVLLPVLVTDLTFKAGVYPAFTLLMAKPVPGLFVTFVSVSLLLTLLLAIWLSVAVTRLERVIASGEADAVERLSWLPTRFAFAWSLHWMAVFALTVRLTDCEVSPASAGCLFAALALAPAPLGHALLSWLTGPALRRAWRVAHERVGAVDVPRRAPLQVRLAASNFALCMSPAFFVAAMGFAPREQVDNAMLFAALPVSLYGIVCALLFARSITGPVNALKQVMDGVRGDASDAMRVPVLGDDELGALSTHTNAMISRLRETALERAAMARSLEGLNRTLEQRVTNAIIERAKVEAELHQAQKLEAIGRLAAGVAHEINNPVQFVSDSVTFVDGAWADAMKALAGYREKTGALPALEEALDLAYLVENVPRSSQRALDGLKRITTIVRSLRDFAAADQQGNTPIDLNQAVTNTLIITRNTYKYVAEIETDLGALPDVICHPGDVNQVLLTVLTNAAHAVEEVVHGSGTHGRIRISTRHEGADAVVTISDTGTGIPDEIRHRIFEPFFTTKPQGKGGGQGLALARASIVERHGGALSFESRAGEGTTFTIRLPVDGPKKKAAQA